MMEQLRLFSELKDAKRILLAGAGGGFDVFCGLPLFFALKRMGHEVFLANMSFSNLSFAEGRRFGSCIVEISADSSGSKSYFPEKYLCQWFEARGEPQSIFGIEATGLLPLRDAYQVLAEHLELDAMVLVDGGTDSLMRGDETELGTPAEDILSIGAVHAVEVPIKALLCLGFGVDSFHGICHAHFLEAVAALAHKGAFWGVFSVLKEMPEAQLYHEATEFVFAKMPNRMSIVNASILSAIQGDYGDVHRTQRTAGSQLYINPLMSMYWSFQLDAVAERLLYLDLLKDTHNFYEVISRIDGFRKSLSEIKPYKHIPV